jgi:hypothetical protein
MDRSENQIGRAKEDEKKLFDTKNEAKSNLLILKKFENETKRNVVVLTCQLRSEIKQVVPKILETEAKTNKLISCYLGPK